MRPALFAALLIFAAPAAAEPRKGTLEDTWKGGKYLLHVPESYQARDGLKWGLWVTLIPGDHVATDYVEVWEEHARERSFLSLVVEEKVAQEQIGALIEKVTADYGLSPHRQGMVGYAEGARRAWKFLFDNPGRLTALAIFQGFPPGAVRDTARGTPVMLVHDRGCSYVPIADARALAKKLTEAGYDATLCELARAGEDADQWPAGEMRKVLDWAQLKAQKQGEEHLNRARELLDAGRPGRALAELEGLAAQGVGADHAPEVAEAAGRCATALEGALKKAKEAAAAGDLDAAGVALEALAEDFRGTSKSAAIEAEIARLSADPAYKAAAEARRKQRLEEQARAAFAEPEKLESEQKWREAMAAWRRVAKDHAGTDAATEAEARAAKLEQDPAIRKQLADAEAADACRKLMQLADAFAKNKAFDKARAKYQEIVDKYPGTSFAEEAKRKQEALK